MKAIKVTYLPSTTTKPARWSVVSEKDKSVFSLEEHRFSDSAVEAFCKERYLHGVLASGRLDTNTVVYVWIATKPPISAGEVAALTNLLVV